MTWTGAQVKALRIKLGMTQQEFAVATGYSGAPVISKIESGEATITPQLVAILNLLSAAPSGILTLRKATYCYYSLPWVTRMGILVRMGLLENEDEGERSLFDKAWDRARKRGVLGTFCQEIAEHYTYAR